MPRVVTDLGPCGCCPGGACVCDCFPMTNDLFITFTGTLTGSHAITRVGDTWTGVITQVGGVCNGLVITFVLQCFQQPTETPPCVWTWTLDDGGEIDFSCQRSGGILSSTCDPLSMTGSGAGSTPGCCLNVFGFTITE